MNLPVPEPIRLSRGSAAVSAAAPVRMVHLGLGNFFRAHQAWYTAHAPDGLEWGIAAFTGRSTELAEALAEQDGLYTLLTRAADGDSSEIVGTLSATHAGTETAALTGYLADPAVAVVSLTVTEAGYVRGKDGHLDVERPAVIADLETLRANGNQNPVLATTPARLVAGLRARRAADAGPLAIVSCDNLPENGRATASVVRGFAQLLDPTLDSWIEQNVGFVTTMVDRITPATTEGDIDVAAGLTGLLDRAPVVTEPFSEWVLCGEFPGGHPDWAAAGARFVSDIVPFEERKLWLLNGGHSLLAYAGSARGHSTIAQAMSDPACRGWLEAWWDEAAAHLTLPPAEIVEYRAALIGRFTNPAIAHQLAQIAIDGSQKIPVRVLPVIRRERADGRVPPAAVRIVAAWINHLRGAGAPVRDVVPALVEMAGGTVESAVARVLEYLDPTLAGDGPLVAAVAQACRELGG